MALARAASIDSASRLASPAAPWRSASSAAWQRASSRAGADLGETRDLRLAHGGGVDVQQLDRLVHVGAVPVDPDHDVLAAVPARLAARRRRLDLRLGHACLDRLGHAAERLDLLDQPLGRARQARGQMLEVVAAAERIDDVADAGLLGEDQLGVAGDPGREVGRQRQRLVEGVGVQRLGAAQHRGERLDRGADHVVVGVRRLQRHAAGLAMGAQHQRARILRRELPLHQLRPQEARGAQLGDLHEEIHADAEEERQARREACRSAGRARRRRARTPGHRRE